MSGSQWVALGGLVCFNGGTGGTLLVAGSSYRTGTVTGTSTVNTGGPASALVSTNYSANGNVTTVTDSTSTGSVVVTCGIQAVD